MTTTTITIRHDADLDTCLAGLADPDAVRADYLARVMAACALEWDGAEIDVDHSQRHCSGATRGSEICRGHLSSRNGDLRAEATRLAELEAACLEAAIGSAL